MTELTDIDCGLAERYALHGHLMVYVELWDAGSILRCVHCGTQVTVHVNDLSAWRTSHDLLDNDCKEGT